MKKNEKRKLWKQGLGTALVCGLAVAVFPAAKADAADLLKAGPINTTAEHVTQNQPFAERTAFEKRKQKIGRGMESRTKTRS